MRLSSPLGGNSKFVIPAKAGIQQASDSEHMSHNAAQTRGGWTPAYAGVTI